MVDIVIVLLLFAAFVAGLRAGLFSALGMVCGLIAGGLAAPWALPAVAGLVTDEAWRGPAVVAAAVLLLAAGAGIGAAMGSLLRRGADRLRIRVAERLLGGAFSLLAAVLAVVLAGAGVASAGIPVVSSAVASSTVLRTIDGMTPEPLDEAMARLHEAVLGDTVLPTIDGLLDDSDLSIAPDAGEIDTDNPQLARAAASVARLTGVARECQAMLSGTGFVAAEDRIVTNAHVVAGVQTLRVELPGEPARDGHVVYFDPVDDLAVVAADVDAAPLPLGQALSPGAGGVIQGYPHGGPFRTVPAGVAASDPMTVADIYGGTGAERDVYALRAQVEPGNSGGPLLTETGEVAGVVFARDEARADVGYAMTNAELMPALEAAQGADQPVATGRCLG
ncbi:MULTISPECIES: MarP family serine protease [Microbacterium]|uniref:MarP family serine protease n=1 Tax=Microbacterium TaxID=33882 RepID=UPI00217F2148|nr:MULTISPECIES: MarP family serine protease [Microbacterium]UWF76997.1 MarP family serine protease [Microbacterium neungamense]WCM55157.1 MarP family serine protease [Microbacterium sp. EF45047]